MAAFRRVDLAGWLYTGEVWVFPAKVAIRFLKLYGGSAKSGKVIEHLA